MCDLSSRSVGPAGRGDVVVESFEYDHGRRVAVYVPADPPEAVVFAGDGQLLWQWSAQLEAADLLPTMIVGVYRTADQDEMARVGEYSPQFAPEHFAAHERFFVGEVRQWLRSRFAVALPAERTAVFGVSAGAELALAMGIRHPDVYGAILCASPGAGYRPPNPMPARLPRSYLVAGLQEPFFLDNASRWARALESSGAEVVFTQRPGSHGGPFWATEFPLMIRWAFA
jgi:enterochelin esterase-like enzyme